MMKAAFFDIDGTLKPFNEIELRDTTIAMLHALQEKGIKVFLARCILWFHGSKRMRIMLVHLWKKTIPMILHLMKHIMHI